MKDILIGGGACLVVGFGVFFSPPFTFGTTEVIDIKNGPVVVASNDEIAQHLMTAEIVDGKPPFYRHQMKIERIGDDAIHFGSNKGMDCTAQITRLDDSRAQVVPKCVTPHATSSAQGAAVQDILTVNFREFVWSKMENRPFDEEKVRTQMAGAAMKHMRGLQQEAIEANIKHRQMEAEWGAERDAADNEYVGNGF